MIDFIIHHYPTISLVFVILLAIFTVVRIIMDTNNSSKTLAYILLVVTLPVAGSIIYFAFGINYRRRKMFSKNILANEVLFERMERRLLEHSRAVLREQHPNIVGAETLATLLINDARSALTYNKVALLINGEQKFPEVIEGLKNARKFIHLEYYIFDVDTIGRQLIDILKERAAAGVTVRFIYDDFGSNQINSSVLAEMRDAGILIYPFYEVKFFLLANRLNYRDHRKIIIIDGEIGFTGGINVSDRYINRGDDSALYWRDTHIKITGSAVSTLQYHFIANWNFCVGKKLEIVPEYFPEPLAVRSDNQDLVQVVAGGPDYPSSSIMLTFFTAIVSAKERIYITSPYFIPNESICDALKIAALSGKDVRLLLPGISDSRIVNAAARSYFYEMLKSGVRIYLYQRGFVHAKTMIVDDNISIVGTANMDARSFDLNFEIVAVVYSKERCSELASVFMGDLRDAEEASLAAWNKRRWWQELLDDIARLLSPLL
jgi:cardiolipin synthase